MAAIQLEELVLLSCDFEMWPERDEQTPQPDPEYPRENLLRWRSSTRREGSEVHLYVDARLDDQRLPFHLRFDMGFRFEVPEEDEHSVEELEPTLLWLAYPYLRELVADVTNRSPLDAYHLPPLTRLPDPRISEGAG